ncbi:MAG: hypothetical protein COZ75_06345 [Flavobacteriaceae bacterium CG_4_8_14_3_um_filter_34_10]|nr:MAG: hypothetical protein COS19_01100 [Flavobacteriaceae bacterium CG02_land_8_20_14_3_00_34_13]PIX09521.1 MAG: hypothetical protein COZ75_06345 [Flavobacteriaceae bacterium CG_4_8_14_3_um_filter_34_10]PJC06482.1 MAG: hypothetical protein CO068_11330 [Flavobacteriaceae bacterium CG_4_9_14_0_8_um_filter_34_30]
MKTATVNQLKKELNYRSEDELLELCLRLSKFKKENKELLTYLLFEADNEEQYIEKVKQETANQFEEINTGNYYWIRKSVRKILKNIKKHIRYSLKPETEIELLLYFCIQLKDFTPSISKDKSLKNIQDRQLAFIKNKLNALHEDLQYDYRMLMENEGFSIL